MSTTPPISPKNLTPAASSATSAQESAGRRLPATTYVDTIDSSSDKCESILFCLGNFACLIYSCISGFCGWVASLFCCSSRNDPDLLANPLKQIDKELTSWKSPEGPITQLFAKLKECSLDSSDTVQFKFSFVHMTKESARSWKGVCMVEETFELSNLELAKLRLAELIPSAVKRAEEKLKQKKMYVDLHWEDRVLLQVDARLPKTIQDPAFGKINTIALLQEASHPTPGLSCYLRL